MKPVSFKSIVDYVDATSELSEHIKRCAKKKDQKLDSDVILALNKLTIAAHGISAFLEMIENERNHIN